MLKRVILDKKAYYVEEGSYSVFEEKVTTRSFTLGERLLIEERGFQPRVWEMTLLCLSKPALFGLAGSFLKRATRLLFSDMKGVTGEVFFDRFGPVERLRRTKNWFRVPVRLVSA